MIYQEIYKSLLKEAQQYNITVKEKNFKSNAKGLCKGNTVAISCGIESYKEKAEILAEEIAHCLFTVGDILDARIEQNQIQEEIARAIARRRMEGKPFPLEIAPAGSYGYYIYHAAECDCTLSNPA